MSTILMYHYLGEPPADAERHRSLHVPERDFAAQLLYLKHRGVRSVSPEKYEAGLSLGALDNTIWITFDDGRLDNFTVGVPALLKMNHVATFFVIAERSLAGDAGFMDKQMMREALAAGMSIGSHSLTHPRLARLPVKEMRREVSESKERLQDALGVEITSFCYPYGNFNSDVIQAVRDAGYRVAVSTIRDNCNVERDRYRLKRAMVQPGRTGMSFRYLLSPLYHWIHARKNKSRWAARKSSQQVRLPE